MEIRSGTVKMYLRMFHILLITSVRADRIIQKSTTSLVNGYYKTYYSCSEQVSTFVMHYAVNVTLNASTELSDNRHTDIKTCDTFWYYLTSNFWAFPPEITINFSLRYRGYPPIGNCTWYFDSHERPETSSPLVMTSSITSDTSTDEPEMTSQDSNSTVVANPTNETCLCQCPCQLKSQDSIDQLMKSIIYELTIAKNSTYRSKQRFISASDKRWMSRGIGCVGILVMTLVFGSIIAADLKRFAVHANLALKRIKNRR